MAAPQSQTPKHQALHSVLLGRPPTSCIVATSIFVTGGEGHKGSCGVCLPSRHQGVPCWIVVHATWHHSSEQRHMASPDLCWPVKPGVRPPTTRDTRCAWQGCTHMAIRPKILSHPTARLGAIRRKAISCLGFSAFPQAPAWERVVSWVCLMVGTVNHWIGREKLSDPYVALELGSHSAVSAHRCKTSLMGIVICN